MDTATRSTRLTLKTDRRATGVVDGAWWPHTRSLVDELPALMASLEERIGPASRVGYSLTSWPAAPRRTTMSGRIVRLGGFYSVPPDVIDLFGPQGRVSLLVVPPDTASRDAHRSLDRAAAAGNTDDTEALLESGGTDPGQASGDDRWENDGGA